MSFSTLSLPEFIVKTCKQVGLKEPTPVQKATIPEILAGHDIVAQSPTGSGKTAAFALPIIGELSKDPYGVFCITLSPTRELAEQIADQFKLFGSGMRISVTKVLGGVSFHRQASDIEKNPHILVATPGRLLDQLKASTTFSLDYLKFLVLDEVDRLFNEGFWKDIEQIVSYLPKERQTLLYSATMAADIPLERVLSNYKEKKEIGVSGNTYFWRPSQVEMPKIEHLMSPVPAHVREVFLIILLEEIMKENEWSQVLIFTSHCDVTQTLTLILRKFKFKTAMLHSKMEQEDRSQALTDFRSGRQRILVATDVAARGLDVPFVDVVIHFNPPRHATTYVHRAGRTGRAGRSGKSIMFVNKQSDAEIVEEIEKQIGQVLGVMQIDEKETMSKMKEVLNAKRDAHVNMFDSGFGEREKRLKNIKDACEELAKADE